MNAPGTHSRPGSQRHDGGVSSGVVSDPNGSAAGQSQAGQRPTRRGEPPPPPELDLLAVRRLCETTDAALLGLTDDELKGHVKELERTMELANSVLEYWNKKLEGLVSEREAFEGVIENLVSHARRVRK